jgi:hypothetical protein
MGVWTTDQNLMRSVRVGEYLNRQRIRRLSGLLGRLRTYVQILVGLMC